MTTTASKQNRIIEKAQNKIANGEYYEAHQLYRTVYYRYINLKRYNELEEILFDGAKILLLKEQYNSGADLALLYIDTIKIDTNLHDRLVSNDGDVCKKISENIGELFRLIPVKSNDRLTYVYKTLQLNSDIFPLYLFNYQFAVNFWNEKNFFQSRNHFLHSSAIDDGGENCALMLIEYHITCGFKAEVDLFITQFILQLLSLNNKNKKKSFNTNLLNNGECTSSSSTASNNCNNQNFSNTDTSDVNRNLENVNCTRSLEYSFADKTLRCFTAKHPDIQEKKPPFLLPLLNFLWFLLLAIESGKSTIFKTLCELYDPSLKRDPMYKEYLEKIGEIYFGIKAPTSNRRVGGLFGNLLQSLFDDNDDNEQTAAAQSSSLTARNLQRATISEEVD